MTIMHFTPAGTIRSALFSQCGIFRVAEANSYAADHGGRRTIDDFLGPSTGNTLYRSFLIEPFEVDA
jgi:hypothetical protein